MILKIVFSISIVIFLSFAVTSYSGYENELFGVNTVLKSVMEYPLPEAVKSLWNQIKFYLPSGMKLNDMSNFNFAKITDVSLSSLPFISHTSAGFFLISLMWFILGRKKGKATETEQEEIIAQNKRLKKKIVDMEKEVSEHREKRLIAEKKLRELEMTTMDKKSEKENKEMLKQLKSAIKEEIAALKCKHEVTEHREEQLKCEKRISELETSMNKKREKENEEMLRQVKSAIKEEGWHEKKNSDAAGKKDGSNKKMEEMKAQRDFYLRQTMDLSYFTVNLQHRLYDELMKNKGHPNCGYDFPEYDRRLLMMHPVVLMTMYNRSPVGSSSSSQAVNTPPVT
ncbi:uncharacterized protein LOC144650086 isoform X2 [Oculina patagonica]